MAISEVLDSLLAMVDKATEELVELHQSLVRIPTINTGAEDSGGEIRVCRLLEGIFEDNGISTIILESAPGRGNLIASIGNAGKPRLLLMGHTDVVPVNEHLWKYPPFSGEIIDGNVYGRGSDDAKSLISTGAMALILLQRVGVNLPGELRFLAAADEEAGGRYGIAWLAENHPNEIRADWALNEGGGEPIMTNAGPVYLLSTGEKGRLEARFQIKGRSSHGARPWLADNAIYRMSKLLNRLQNYEPQLDISLPIFSNLSVLGIDQAARADGLDALLEDLGRLDPGLATLLKALSRMSIAPTIATAGIKSNSIPAAADLICDIRTLPHQDKNYVHNELDSICAGLGSIELVLEETALSNASPYKTPFVSRIQRATALALGRSDIQFLPTLTVGFTDSRYVRTLGTQVYGFAPLVPGSDTARPGVHGIDESMEIDNLVFRTKMLVTLALLTLSKDENTGKARI